jgi:DNA-binding LytR/AlgR family response regulator
MSALKAVIAEDEPLLRGELKETLAAVWPELVVCAEAERWLSRPCTHCRRTRPTSCSSIFRCRDERSRSRATGERQVPRRIRDRLRQVCNRRFRTGRRRLRDEAFLGGASSTTVARLKTKVASAPANLGGILKALAAKLESEREYLRWITASQGQNLRLITVEEICYFQADNKYTLVVTADNESLIRRPIKELVDEVDPKVFWQIHRSTLVNVNAIAGVTRDFKGRLNVRLKQRKETLPVSESYVHLFKQM